MNAVEATVKFRDEKYIVTMSERADHYLDITAYVCPITFVKTKLLLEHMNPGETAEIRLNAGEPLENVPRSVIEHGHTVLDLAEETAPDGTETGVHVLRLKKEQKKS